MMKSKYFLSLFMYLLGFLLLWEWIRPLEEITDTGDSQFFVYFIGLSILLKVGKIQEWVSRFIKAGTIIVFLYLIFGYGHQSFVLWGKETFLLLLSDCKSLLSLQIVDFSNTFQTLLCFLLLWIMAYLLEYWLMVRKRIFIFFLMTICYIAIIDTFTGYNGEWAIIRTILTGFTLVGVLYMDRLQKIENITRPKLIWKWTTLLLCIIMFNIILGYAVPKAGPTWPDPVPFIKSQADNVYRSNGVSKVGYGEDDTHLGGDFIHDEQLVFTVATNSKRYWRIETKDTYTGKGWTTSVKSSPQGNIKSGELFPLDVTATEEPLQTAEITMELPFSHVNIPYGFQTVKGNEEGFFKFDSGLNKLIAFKDEKKKQKLDQYEILFQEPVYNLVQLRDTRQLPNEPKFEGFLERYTQLPDTLPERVKELAHDLTGNYYNWYDKAEAIRAYFEEDDFHYSNTEVAVPGKNEDYVDQFIFDTKVGYCDNFSTSMVVLLRAAGIPARWAKGFTTGERAEVNGEHVYQVTNNQAHSWVEVYFPTQGWVPFEPTIGYFNNLNVETVYNEYEEYEEEPEYVPEVELEEPDIPVSQPDVEAPNETPEYQVDTDQQETKAFISSKLLRWIALAIVIVLLAAVILLYVKRSKWMPSLLLKKYSGRTNQEVLMDSYEDLLKQLERIGYKREAGQTLRDFATYIDFQLKTTEMTELTYHYEQWLYYHRSDEQQLKTAKQLWENIIKKATG